jgi:hypothetical protein
MSEIMSEFPDGPQDGEFQDGELLKREKDAKDVAYQVSEISRKIARRALRLEDVSDTEADFSVVVPDTSTGDKGRIAHVKHIDPDSGVRHDLYAQPKIKWNNKVAIVMKTDPQKGENVNIGVAPGVVTASLHNTEGQPTELSLDQSVSTAADALGHLRGEVARREIAQRQATQPNQ